MRFDPPRLVRGPLSGNVFVVTHGKDLGEGRIEASSKYDVSEQFDALADELRAENEALRAYLHTVRKMGELAGWQTIVDHCDEALASAPR